MRLQYKIFMDNNAINNAWTPIARKTYNLTNHFQKDHQAIRDQFPLVPCEALTIHKSQGQTYDAVCVDFRKSGNLTRQLVYVAVSRVSKLSGLYILGKFPGNMKSNNTINSSLNEMERLRKERQLALVFNNLENKNGIVICYLNIRSLRKNIAHILADKWYSRCDILIFAETCLYHNEKIWIPGFEKFYRSDKFTNPAYVKKNVAKGIMCFAKTGMNIKIIQTHQSFKRDDKGKYLSHIDLVSFMLTDTLIITGYKSPKTNFDHFKNSMTKFNVNEASRTVLLDDFNFNLNDKRSYQVQDFQMLMSSLHLKDCLQSSMATTNVGSRLDVIFSNKYDLQTGLYECYFSDHKPIFTILKKNRTQDAMEEPSRKTIKYSEPYIDHVELSSEDGSICEDDRKIECSSIQCSDVDEDTDHPRLNTNIVDWINTVDAPSNINDYTSGGMLKNVQQIFSSNYETFVIPEELSMASMNHDVMLYKRIIDHLTNHLRTLPVALYDCKRDILYSDQVLRGFSEISITGDGNCQFNSISYALVGNESFAIDLRLIAFQSVIENSQFFQKLADNSFLESVTVYDLLKICCEDRQWGNTDTLFALSMKLKRTIIILQKSSIRDTFLKIVPPHYEDTISPIVLHLRNPGSNNAHYNVLLPHDNNVSYEFPSTEEYNLSTLFD